MISKAPQVLIISHMPAMLENMKSIRCSNYGCQLLSFKKNKIGKLALSLYRVSGFARDVGGLYSARIGVRMDHGSQTCEGKLLAVWTFSEEY
jgi:hypothetical protein